MRNSGNERLRKAIKKFISLTLVLLIVAAVISGCSKESTLESYVKNHPSEEEGLAQLTDDDPNARIEFDGNIMRIVYTLPEIEGNREDVKDILDEAMETMGDVFREIIQELEEKTGIVGIKIEIIYEDSAGEEVTMGLFE